MQQAEDAAALECYYLRALRALLPLPGRSSGIPAGRLRRREGQQQAEDGEDRAHAGAGCPAARHTSRQREIKIKRGIRQ